MLVKTTYCITLIISLLSMCFSAQVFAQHHLSARLQIGINLLPGVIAANVRLKKDSAKQEKVTIYIVYQQDIGVAVKALQQLGKIKKIRGHQLTTEIYQVDQLLQLKPDQHAAVLMVEPLSDFIDPLIDYCKVHQLILFSPFKGDVQKGVMSGFEVTNKVLPAVNVKAMQMANINLKAFFLRIAVKYD